jgi:hypothetical protein
MVMSGRTWVVLALGLSMGAGCHKTGLRMGASDGGAGGPGVSVSADGWLTFSVLQTPVRAVDVLFMVDNSPSMDPKQQALATNFPAMIKALQGLPGGMPDLRIGVVSSDMGAGQTEAGGNCAWLLGNRGILWGNDPTVDPGTQYNGYATVKGMPGGCGMNEGARWIEDIQSLDGIGRDKNYTGNLPDVFSCLARAVGVNGCGYEHQLQSIKVALNPSQATNPQNLGFLRRQAYLAIVIITDEDDCSASPSSALNDGVYFPRTLGDTASLRCAARGHVCNGKAIPNYDPNQGYTGTNPFVANFADCDAKDDADHHKLPLIRVRDMIDGVKQVKERPDEQILVSGIIGWPVNVDLSGVQYRIDKDPTSLPVEQQKLWDYMPICSIPSEESADGNIYKAYGGFRLKNFIEGFGGRTFSVCARDFTPAMSQIGNALAQKLKPACVPQPLLDFDAAIPGTQPLCQVTDALACERPGQASCPQSGYQETALPQCLDPATGNPLDPYDPNTSGVPDDAAHRPCWYLTYDFDPNTGCAEESGGQRIAVLRPTGNILPAGSSLHLRCRVF